MSRASSGGTTAFRFTQREVSEMEKVLESSKGSAPTRVAVLSLAENFNNHEERAGQNPIQWKQVSTWFQNKRYSQKVKAAKSADLEKLTAAAVVSDQQPKNVQAHSGTVASTARSKNDSQPTEVQAPSTSGTVAPGARSKSDSPQMEYEAKSARDGAWYDISTRLSHRLTASGESEFRVRFSGFGSGEDEWVNSRSALRQRSLPCEGSDCVAILQGDLVLCFQEGNDQALHFDADVLDVQRRRHDIRGCRCRFWVRYRHDQSQEVIPLRKLCRRPETEFRLVELQSHGNNPVMVPEVQPQPAGSKPDTPLSALVADFTSPSTSSAVALGSEVVHLSSSQPLTSISATMPSTVAPTAVHVPSSSTGLAKDLMGGSKVPASGASAPAGISSLSQGGLAVAKEFSTAVDTTTSAMSATTIQPTVLPGRSLSATSSEQIPGVPLRTKASQS